MMGKEVHAQEGWSVLGEVTGFGKALLKAQQLEDDLVWHGISCPCCDANAYYWYRLHMPSKQLSFF